MYRKNHDQLEFEDFYLPFGGKLKSSNRWVRLAKVIPWDEFEEMYSGHFSGKMGAPGKSVRFALGALIIKERLGTSDEEAVEQIRENPYLQYFLGYHEFRDELPFDPSMYVHFRKRFTPEMLAEINERIVSSTEGDTSTGNEDDDDSNNGNSGKLLIDATCAPADIAYPTDLNLLNEAREKSESLIDKLHAELTVKEDKPRTYRRNARRDYLKVARKKRVGSKVLHKAVGKQLAYLRRNLTSIETLAKEVGLCGLSSRSYQNLLVIQEVYRQQLEMFMERKRRVNDRIVSISQPHIRPIVRGKVKAPVEFGAKLSVSVINGYTYLDRLSFDAYNESEDLSSQVEMFKERTGHYPESVHADQIYRTRANLAYCKEKGIRLSGPPLGRPSKDKVEHDEKLKQAYNDEVDRIPVEGKFGQAKRRFSLNRIMTKLASTSRTAIAITFITMNLEKWLRGLSWLRILATPPKMQTLFCLSVTAWGYFRGLSSGGPIGQIA